MKLREQDILEMMIERLDRDVLVFDSLHYPIGSYYDLSIEPYEAIKNENPEKPELYLMYW